MNIWQITLFRESRFRSMRDRPPAKQTFGFICCNTNQDLLYEIDKNHSDRLGTRRYKTNDGFSPIGIVSTRKSRSANALFSKQY